MPAITLSVSIILFETKLYNGFRFTVECKFKCLQPHCKIPVACIRKLIICMLFDLFGYTLRVLRNYVFGMLRHRRKKTYRQWCIPAIPN